MFLYINFYALTASFSQDGKGDQIYIPASKDWNNKRKYETMVSDIETGSTVIPERGNIWEKS